MTGYKSKKAAAQDKLAQPADPTGQAPCVRHCESTAYEIVIRGLKGDIERLKAAQRPWADLTDEDEIDWEGGDLKSLIKAIEAKLKEKNT